MSATIGLLACAILLVAWLTAAATAVRSVSRIWLRRLAQQPQAAFPTAAQLVLRPRRLLLAARAGIAALVALCGVVLGAVHGTRGWMLGGELVGTALVVLLFGQLLPRAIARHWAPQLVPVLLPPLQAAAALFAPLVRAVHALVARLRPPPVVAPADSLRDEVEDLLREGELDGIGEHEENRIIAGVIQFGERMVRDIMTPASDVVALDVAAPPAAAARAIARAGYSRIPVYRGSRTHIVGMVHALDIFKANGDCFPPVRDVSHVRTTTPCSEMLFEMLDSQCHLALVLDEAGRTVGIVTLEDVLEELVGGIREEGDEPAPPAALHRAS
jgi:putative hemolysin